MHWVLSLHRFIKEKGATLYTPSMVFAKALHARDSSAYTSAVAVLAPAPHDSTFAPGDGYLRRVQAIDTLLFDNVLRLYIYNSPHWSIPLMGFGRIDDHGHFIVYNSNISSHVACVLKLLAVYKRIYIHSAYRLLPPFGEADQKARLDLFSLKGIHVVWDVHGATLYELLMNRHNALAQMAEEVEKQCISKADHIITVTDAMQAELDKRVLGHRQKMITLPIFDNSGDSTAPQKALGTTPVVIYSGGIQAWQCIDEMVCAATACKRPAIFRFFVNDAAGFIQKAGQSRHPDWQIENLSKEDLIEQYRQANFGFLLREDSIVNYVACPTKLIEYLSYGIIPILQSTQIGDFVDKGMQYLTLDDFVAGKWPDDNRYRQMVLNNLEIVGKLVSQSRQAIRTLKEIW